MYFSQEVRLGLRVSCAFNQLEFDVRSVSSRKEWFGSVNLFEQTLARIAAYVAGAVPVARRVLGAFDCCRQICMELAATQWHNHHQSVICISLSQLMVVTSLVRLALLENYSITRANRLPAPHDALLNTANTSFN